MKQIQGLVEILVEAAAVLDKVREQEPEAWEKFGLRDYLVDELQGTALIVKDAQAAPKEQTKQVAPFLSDAPIELIEQWAKMPTKIQAAPTKEQT